MERSENHRDAASLSRSGKEGRDATHPPSWISLIRRRRSWARTSLFHWPSHRDVPGLDNHIVTRLDAGIGMFSRLMGPMLFLAALAVVLWWIAHWFF